MSEVPIQDLESPKKRPMEVDEKPEVADDDNKIADKRGNSEPAVKQEEANVSSNEDGKEVKRVKVENDNEQLVVVPPTRPQLFYTPLKTGLVYDVRMRYHAKIFTSYSEYIDPHPEDPRRIYRIYKKLAEGGLIQDSSLAGKDEIGELMQKIPTREATAEEILEVHSEEHLKFILETESMSRERLLEETEKGDSIYVNNDSFFSAKLSCGGAIEACKAVIEGRVKNALAVVRPPGHHAEPGSPGGFCLFSNVAVAAKNILKNYPESVRRIVIVDWDIHHGNGTQKAFYNDPRVLYISLHRYENGKFYPGTKYGAHTQTGEGKGEGYSVNIPWSIPGMGDGDYFYAFNKVVIPIITEFDPDLIIVSSGFDAADGDIIGECHVTPTGYGYMTHSLKGIAKGKMCVVLEGGYNLDSISKSALAVAKVLVGEPPDGTIRAKPRFETIEVISDVIKTQSKYWDCMKPGNPNKSLDDVYELPSETSSHKLMNISDPLRSFQAEELFNKYSFINIPIVFPVDRDNEKHSNFFSCDLPPNSDNLIVASHDIYDCTTLVVVIHDPPQIWANINPINGNIDGGGSIILDYPLTHIIQRVNDEVLKNDDINEKVGYIDINIPSYSLASPSVKSSNSNGSSLYNPTLFAQELLLYVWDNYINYFSKLRKLVFVGFGDAYQSIVHLYAKRASQEIRDVVQGTVAFVDRSSLKPLVPVMDESMVDWFYQNSVIFTSCHNPCWNGTGTSNGTSNRDSNGPSNEQSNSDETSKKPRRKFGRVLKASADGLWEVMVDRVEEGIDFILDSIEDYSSSEGD